MLAGYNTRRTSVVLNPRGRVLGGLGEESGGSDAESYGGDIYGGGDADTAAFVASQMADEAALAAAAQALAQSHVDNRAAAQKAANIANTAVSFLGPVGMVAGLISRATGFAENAIFAALDGKQLSYDTNIADANKALEGARGYAGDDAALKNEINIVQANIDKAKKASIEAAVTQLYQTYAKRNPDPAALAYWSQRFGPTITADEVLQFQQFLYANEPNLRPVAMTTTASQPGNNLALPIIAAVAAYFVLGA